MSVYILQNLTLFQDLINFINGSGEAGFIYFSFGSFLQGSQLPEKFQLAFLRAFSKLKQRVIWKFETEEMENLPSNVKLVKWLPQQDLLAHPSIRQVRFKSRFDKEKSKV